MKFRSIVALLFLVACAASLQAHPGHDIGSHGVAHALTSPFHLSILAGSGLVLVAVAHWLHKSRAQLALRLSGSALLIAAVVLWFR